MSIVDKIKNVINDVKENIDIKKTVSNAINETSHLLEKNVAYLINTKEDVVKYNTDFFTISRGMVNVMSGIRGIDIWANFTEEESGKVIVELRSSKYNVNQIAVKYGGGGHKFASGATIDNLNVINDVLKDLDNLMEE